MSRISVFRSALICTLLAPALLACSSDDASGGSTIGAAGGTVSNGAAKVVVPAGALASDTSIGIAVAGSGYPALPAGLTQASNVYAFTPHGTQFNASATVTIPLNSAAGSSVTLWKAEAGASSWSEVSGATVAGGAISANVSSFSFFAATSGSAGPSLDEFCNIAIKACTSVTLARCKQIVTDANKTIDATDLGCMQAASTCQDTSDCLDAMKPPQPDMGNNNPDMGPTSRPSP